MNTNTIALTPRFEWGAIIAGAALALAITIVLLQFGAAIGLSSSAPLRGEANLASWGIIATGIWLLWVQLLSALAGGYLAGRMRTPQVGAIPHDVELRDGIIGLCTWAVSTVAVFIGASMAAGFASYIAAATGTYDTNQTLTDAEQNSAIIFAFAAGATSLLSAVAAWWAGTMGGDHRDQNTDFSTSLSFKHKR